MAKNREAMADRLTDLTHTVYPHDQIYGEFCTVHSHIDCPAEDVFAYMSNPYSLLEWTYSIRRLRATRKSTARSSLPYRSRPTARSTGWS